VDLNYRVQSIFPCPIHMFDVNGFGGLQKVLIDYAYNERKNDPIGVNVSNRGGWQSQNISVSNEADPLHKFLIDIVSSLPPLIENVDVIIDTWININKIGDYNVKHCHPNSNLAGILWVKIPDKSSLLKFSNPLNYQTYGEIEAYNDEFKELYNYHHAYNFTPNEGTILIFPSHLEHCVEENKSDEDRISISFNLQLINK